ncbi:MULTISPECIES: amidase family protein [Bacillaceae]|uniref:Amidase n=1 Tax=Evansella alkalicola TaxID=745819 RepID=A0ABS6K1M8_9BACI|nr:MULTISPECIES: amidase family protein [Bacillaceae]MBU9723342.1 amidase [Bacillus alkalicola]
MLSIENYDGLELGRLIRTKEVQRKELVEAVIQRIEDKNPAINAVVNKMYEKALKTAEEPLTYGGKFAGVPTLMKDITQEIAGEPITSGSKAFSSYISERDSEYVKRVKETGAIIVGQTNVPELALMGVTEPQHHGATRNPWNVNHTPGGSSGGAAAVVAAGIVPFAGANDGGGSIRIPAAYCGLFGLKPTRGRTPVGPLYGRHWQGASVDHFITRSVRDSAAMLDELNVFEKTAAFHAPPYEGSYLQCAESPTEQKLRIAFTVESPLGTEVHDDCKEAVLSTVKLLEEMGHSVEEKTPDVNGKTIAKSYLTMYFGEVSATLSSAESVLGRKISMSDVEPTTWLLRSLGKVTSAEEFVLSLREWDKAAFVMESFHETYDLYITPTTAFPPAKIGELDPSGFEKVMVKTIGRLGLSGLLKKTGFVDELAEKSLMRTPFTQLANFTGQPAMSLPLYLSEEGLPCGVQVMAARGREDLLIEFAAGLEKTDRWIDIKKSPLI